MTEHTTDYTSGAPIPPETKTAATRHLIDAEAYIRQAKHAVNMSAPESVAAYIRGARHALTMAEAALASVTPLPGME
uniref:Uncharacterized protein n=1 Tax=viral metagenome TaxID=1070528 RepID=A0A6M3J637_9ZZZZ